MAETRIHQVLAKVGSIAFPGVYDTLSAMLAQRAGFPMAFISGYSVPWQSNMTRAEFTSE
jgi:2-methylisocitrate lyase-like PEP mutase family enzyme